MYNSLFLADNVCQRRGNLLLFPSIHYPFNHDVQMLAEQGLIVSLKPIFLDMNIFSLYIIDNKMKSVLLTFCILGCAFVGGMTIAEPHIITIYAQNATNGVPGNNTMTAQSNTTRGSASPLQNLTIDHAGGVFTSLQVDTNNKTWITTGNWDLNSDPSRANLSDSSVHFNATILSKGTDNSGRHEHKISEFKLLNRSFSSGSEGSEFVFNGTGSVETEVGLYTDVPISIKMTDRDPAIISIDTQTNEIKPEWIAGGGTIGVLIDERVEDHFGNTPIYGDVKRE
jgi:hypothetical protein